MIVLVALAACVVAIFFAAWLFEVPHRVAGAPLDADLESAALDVLYPRIVRVFEGDSAEQVAASQASIDRLRVWTATLTDRRVAAAYNGWLDFFQQRADAAKVELSSHSRKKRMEKYDRELAEKRERIAPLVETLPKPPR